MRIFLPKTLLKALSVTDFGKEWIEKARKGEMMGGEYMFRENVAEKTTEKNGKKIVRRYKYYYVKDMLKQSAKDILETLGKFVFKKNPEELQKIDKAYTTLNIKKDFNADKKTFFQHVCEYFSNRSHWDKAFSDKNKREKVKKPVTMEVAAKIETSKDAPKHQSDVLEFDFGDDSTKKKPEFIPNRSLMYKIWTMYSGKAVEKQEKQAEIVKENSVKVNNPDVESKNESGETYDRVNVDEIARTFRNDDKIYTWFNGLNAKYTIENKGRIYNLIKTRVEELLNQPSDNPLSGIPTKYAAHTEKDVENIVDQMLKNNIEQEESESEKHENRSEAMIGNQNAKKDGIEDDYVPINDWNNTLANNIKSKDFIAEFNKQYDFLYNHEGNDHDIAGYDSAIEAYDRYKDNPLFIDFVKRMIDVRGDYFTSDREIAALMFTVDKLGLITPDNTEAEMYKTDEYNYTKIAYKDVTSKHELEQAVADSERAVEDANDMLYKLQDELKNPADPGMFATPETIAENEKNIKANIKQIELQIAQEEGKQQALNEMLSGKNLGNITRDEILNIIDKKIEAYRKLGDLDARKGWEVTREHFANHTESDFEQKMFGFNPEDETVKPVNDKAKEMIDSLKQKQSKYDSITDEQYKNELSGLTWSKEHGKLTRQDAESKISDLNQSINELKEQIKPSLPQNVTATYNELIAKHKGSLKALQKIVNDFESEAEKHNNRSAAMMGNQNARKYGFNDEAIEWINDTIARFERVAKGKGWGENRVIEMLANQLQQTARVKTTLGYNSNVPEILKKIRSENKKLSYNDIAIELYKDSKEVENGTNNIGIESTGISGSAESVRTAGETSSNENVSFSGDGSEQGESGISADESGIRPTAAESLSGITGDRERGRLTKGQARKIRAACKKLLAEKSDSEMTEADKALLAQYVGGGGLDEDDATNSNILYEFYTPRNVIDKVWQLVDKYIPNQNKKVIEPSSGIGRFAEGRKENFTLFELEEESARIAKILHPESEVVQGAFQENFMGKGRFTKKNFEKFDCAIGNPPYGKYSGKYKGMGEGKGHTRYDEYFIDRTLDTLKDGGILAFVMPSHFLESGDSKIKQKLAEKGKLLEAWRLPNGTFDSTDVGTDIVIIRKEKGNAEDFSNSKYFADNPSHIAGEVATRRGRFGEESYIKVKDGETFESAVENIDVNAVEVDKKIENALKQIDVKVTESAKAPIEISANKKLDEIIDTPDGKKKITGYVKSEGKIIGYTARSDKDVKSSTYYISEKKTEAEKHANRSRAMKGNKNAAGEHEFTPSIGKNMTAAEFNEKYGKQFDPKDIEIWKTTDNFGNVDETKLTDEQKKYIESSDHYVIENGKYTNVVNYAAGNIREKLENLDPKDEKYEFKKSLLESVLPPEKKIGQFKMSPIADWTEKYKTKDGMDLINGFFAWAYNGNGYYSASNSPISTEEIPPEISFYDIADYIHAIPVRAESRNGEDKMYNARVAYRKREKRREAAERLFNRYLKEGLSLEDQKDLEKAWNDNFNTYVNPDYTKIPVFVDGMNTHKGTKEFNLTPQQLKGVTQLTNKGTGLLAYDVGVGKTATGIVATVNQLQTGRAKRPLICVPKAVYKNWIGTIHQLFPNIKVNELGNMSKQYVSENFEPEDGSISVCTYEGIEKIEFNAEEEEKIAADVEFGAMRTDTSDMSKRAAASHSEKIEETVGGMLKTAKGDTVQFSKMGFDHITVDEVHNFRNLFSVPKKIHLSEEEKNDPKSEANEFKALGGGKPSNRAMKLFAITQLIQRDHEGRNTFLLSATPFQNSPIEIYSILSYMARDRLKELGIYSLEQFVKQFAELKSEYVVKVNKIEEKMVMKNFNNLTALQNLITEYIDKVDGEEAGVVRPEKQTHAPELELTDLQKAIMDECNDYIEEQEGKAKDDRDPGYMFRAMNAMRNCALSPALVDDDFFPAGYDRPPMKEIVESSPKLKFVCDSVAAQYKDNSKNGQVIYMPSGVEQFPEVRDYLVRHGVPKDAIALMKGAASTDKALDERQATMDEFNDVNGKCKVIIGSSTIKEGVSLNGNSTVIYNTQLDWNPTDAQQVEGRIWRQGNKQGITHIVYPLMHDSIDSMIYQKYDEKGSRINDLFSYKGDNLNVEDINPEELKFGLIKDPNKRADMQVRQFKEKAEGDQKLYAQMIDVLHKQENIAFMTDKDIEDKVSINMPYNFNVAEYQKNVDSNIEQQKKWEKKLADLKKQWKGKEADFNHSLDSDTRYSSDGMDGKDGLERTIRNFEMYINDYKTRADSYKKTIDRYNKEIKNGKKQRETVRSYLKSKNIETKEDLNNKVKEYVALMDEARDNLEKADSMRETFYQQAVEYNKANEKDILPLEDMVKESVKDIENNLRPMDEEWKGVLKQRLYEKYPNLKKSLFIIKDGKFLIRKSM